MTAPSQWQALRIVATISWRASLRQRVFSVVGLLALILLCASLVFRTFEFGGDIVGFVTDFGFGLMLFFGSLLAVMLPSQRWFSEMDGGFSLPVLGRPVSRAAFFVGQWIGLAGVLGAFLSILGCVLGGLLIWEISSLGFQVEVSVGDLVLEVARASAMQLVRLWVIAAFVLFLGSFARGSLLVTTLSFLFVLAGQLMPAALAYENPSALLPTVVWQSVLALVPNLGAFALHGGVSSGADFWRLVLYGFLYIGVYLSLGAWSFSKRDLG